MPVSPTVIVPFEKTNQSDLISIIERVWYSNNKATSESTRLLATIDMAYYASVSTHRFVAKQNNQVVGFIFCSNGSKPSDSKDWKRLEENTSQTAHQLLSEKRMQDFDVFGAVESSLIKKYRKESNTSSTWEITLFCVDPNVKGTGVGGTLFSHALQFFKEQHAKNYFLATDDDCDVNFYKHQGLSCVDEAPIQTSDKNFGSAYIYAGEL